MKLEPSGYKPKDIQFILGINAGRYTQIKQALSYEESKSFYSYYDLLLFRLVDDSDKSNEVKIAKLKSFKRITWESLIDYLYKNSLISLKDKFLVFEERYCKTKLVLKSIDEISGSAMIENEIISLKESVIEHQKYFGCYDENFHVSQKVASDLLCESRQTLLQWRKKLELSANGSDFYCFELIVLRVITHMKYKRGFQIRDFVGFDWYSLKTSLHKHDYVGLRPKLLAFDFENSRCLIKKSFKEFKCLNIRGKVISLEKIIDEHIQSFKDIGIGDTFNKPTSEELKQNVISLRF